MCIACPCPSLNSNASCVVSLRPVWHLCMNRDSSISSACFTRFTFKSKVSISSLFLVTNEVGTNQCECFRLKVFQHDNVSTIDLAQRELLKAKFLYFMRGKVFSAYWIVVFWTTVLLILCTAAVGVGEVTSFPSLSSTKQRSTTRHQPAAAVCSNVPRSTA